MTLVKNVESPSFGNGSCFFDSFRQSLEQQKEIQVTVEQLRKDCKEFAQNNPPKWFTDAIDNSYGNNDQRRSETVDDYTVEIMNNGRWGDPDIEGRILCGKYGVSLHVLESNPLYTVDNQQDPYLHQLINVSGSKSVDEDKVNYDDNNVLHIINKGSVHFEPLLDESLAKPQQEDDEWLEIVNGDECVETQQFESEYEIVDEGYVLVTPHQQQISLT